MQAALRAPGQAAWAHTATSAVSPLPASARAACHLILHTCPVRLRHRVRCSVIGWSSAVGTDGGSGKGTRLSGASVQGKSSSGKHLAAAQDDRSVVVALALMSDCADDDRCCRELVICNIAVRPKEITISRSNWLRTLRPMNGLNANARNALVIAAKARSGTSKFGVERCSSRLSAKSYKCSRSSPASGERLTALTGQPSSLLRVAASPRICRSHPLR